MDSQPRLSCQLRLYCKIYAERDWNGTNQPTKRGKFQVDRCFEPQGFCKVVSYQLHHFSDASRQAYGAVSLLRSVNDQGTAPLISITVPRLQLSAATVASRLDKMIQREIKLPLQDSVILDGQHLSDKLHQEQRQTFPHVFCKQNLGNR